MFCDVRKANQLALKPSLNTSLDFAKHLNVVSSAGVEYDASFHISTRNSGFSKIGRPDVSRLAPVLTDEMVDLGMEKAVVEADNAERHMLLRYTECPGKKRDVTCEGRAPIGAKEEPHYRSFSGASFQKWEEQARSIKREISSLTSELANL